MVTRTSCVVCRKAGDNVTFHQFPTNPVLKKIWISRLPLKDFKLRESSRLCSKHFIASDYKQESTDSNKRRKKTCLSRKVLKLTALPSVWPSTTAQTLKKVPAPRPTSHASAEERARRDAEEKRKIDMIKDFASLRNANIAVPDGVKVIIEDSQIAYLNMEFKINESPQVKQRS